MGPNAVFERNSARVPPRPRAGDLVQEATVGPEGVQYDSIQLQYETMGGTVWCSVFSCSMAVCSYHLQYAAAVCSIQCSMQQKYAPVMVSSMDSMNPLWVGGPGTLSNAPCSEY